MSILISLVLCMWMLTIYSSWLSYTADKAIAKTSNHLPLRTTSTGNAMEVSWSRLHEYYNDHVLFAKSRSFCICDDYLFPLQKNLFFVNNAVVSMRSSNTIYIPVGRNERQCRGKTRSFRFTKLILGSVYVGK